MKDWLIAHLPDPILTAVFAVVGWWMQRKVARSEALEARVAALEQQRVTKDDFDELRESMNATFTNGIERVETAHGRDSAAPGAQRRRSGEAHPHPRLQLRPSARWGKLHITAPGQDFVCDTIERPWVPTPLSVGGRKGEVVRAARHLPPRASFSSEAAPGHLGAGELRP
jgi:hypothetical protein